MGRSFLDYNCNIIYKSSITLCFFFILQVIFITEYMSSGSLKQFLKRTKRNVKKLPLQAWKRWCTQILSALSYLHSCSPPVIHGNLTCDTIFIQHNGLVKIGSVAPDSIHHHVKTCGENIRNMHFIAPEYGCMRRKTHLRRTILTKIDFFFLSTHSHIDTG